MRRRVFIAVFGSAAVAWPLAALARQPERVKHVGVLMDFEAGKPEGQVRQMAFAQGLQHLGWTEGNNIQIDTRWAGDDADRERRFAAELVAMAPDVILASTSSSVAALQRVTHTVPIVFADVIDPVGAGFVAGLARPGGNTTGFSTFEYDLSGKWLELLKQLAPNVTRVAVLREDRKSTRLNSSHP
jgi:putative ABC transport system substrate-binding protein